MYISQINQIVQIYLKNQEIIQNIFLIFPEISIIFEIIFPEISKIYHFYSNYTNIFRFCGRLKKKCKLSQIYPNNQIYFKNQVTVFQKFSEFLK